MIVVSKKLYCCSLAINQRFGARRTTRRRRRAPNRRLRPYDGPDAPRKITTYVVYSLCNANLVIFLILQFLNFVAADDHRRMMIQRPEVSFQNPT